VFLSSLEIYHDTVPRSAAMNMALDEVLWQSAGTPLLRFYEWDHPALSFGYFGRYADVAQYGGDQEVVRRCTGGGIVFHGNDLTYALIIPSNDQRPESSPMTIYGLVHEAIQRALRAVGTEAVLANANNCRASVSDAMPSHRDGLQSTSCFANPVAYDVMINEQKIAGAAQRRSRRGLLQQGSIQNVKLPAGFRERFIAELCEQPNIIEIAPGLLKQAQLLAHTKYGSDAWLHRR
jgi:lipoyl(octanoyl) transferase